MASLSDFEKLIRDFMVQKIREKYSNIPMGDNSPFNDLFVNPMIEVMKPFIAGVNKWDLNQDLQNASIMEPSDLDIIGTNNYFTPRLTGKKATGNVNIVFKNVPLNAGITIPQGTIVSKDANHTYLSVAGVSISASELVAYYNSSNYTYEIPVLVESAGRGVEFNANPNEISKLDSVLTYATGSTFNPSPISNGSDEESNAEYAARIKEFYVSRNLGTDAGYTKYVKDNFVGVADARVVGYKHPLMQRDLINTITGTVHTGGKVDIYVKGAKSNSYTQTYTVLTDKFYLDNVPIFQDSVVITNMTSPSNTVLFTIGYDNPANAGTTSEKSYVTITNGCTNNDKIRIDYRYRGANGDTLEYTQHEFFNSTKVILRTKPLTEVTSVKNKTQETSVDSTNQAFDTVIPSGQYFYVYEEPNIAGSSRESTVFMLSYPAANRGVLKTTNPNTYWPYYRTGDTIEVTYSYNSLVSDIQSDIDSVGKRIITTDAVVRSANPAYIYVKMNLKVKSGKIMGSLEKGYIKDVISSYVNSLKFSDKLYASEVLNRLYQDTKVMDFLEYVSLPITFYSLPIVESSFRTESNSFQTQNSSIELGEVDYPTLRMIDVIEIANSTVIQKSDTDSMVLTENTPTIT